MTQEFNFGSLFNSGSNETSKEQATNNPQVDAILEGMGLGKSKPVGANASSNGLGELLEGLREALEGKKAQNHPDEEEMHRLFEKKYGSIEEFTQEHFPKMFDGLQRPALEGVKAYMEPRGLKADVHVMMAAFNGIARDIQKAQITQNLSNPMQLITHMAKTAAITKTIIESVPDETLGDTDAIISACLTIVQIKLAELQAHREADRLMGKE